MPKGRIEGRGKSTWGPQGSLPYPPSPYFFFLINYLVWSFLHVSFWRKIIKNEHGESYDVDDYDIVKFFVASPTITLSNNDSQRETLFYTRLMHDQL
jgi:hypothetical protein